MGYTTTTNSIFPPDMPQTPENVRKVLDIAGWTAEEAAHATGINTLSILAASTRGTALILEEWQKLLDAAGRRSFDHDGESV